MTEQTATKYPFTKYFRANKTAVFVLASLLFTISLFSAQKKWEKLTNCIYIDNKSNDGDSFYVKYKSDLFILRLYYIDAPECDLSFLDRVREQSDYFSVTLDETLALGRQVREEVRRLLREPFDIETRRASALGRSKEPRYYGLVNIRGKSLIELLIQKGLVRIKGVSVQLPTGEKSKDYLKKLETLENEAKANRLGAWKNSTNLQK